MVEPIGKIIFLSGDLMFASRVRGAAENAGLSFAISGRLPEEDAAPIRFVVLDLATMSKLTDDIRGQCATHCPTATLIAYGPHVQVAKLDAAKAAGIPIVLTRGQFDHQLPTLFLRPES